MNKRFVFIFMLYILSSNPGILFSSDSLVLDFLPEYKLFPEIFLDPMECQFFGGIYALDKDAASNTDLLSLVNMGLSKPLMHYYFQQATLELNLDVASFTQFEIDRIDRNTSLGGLLNNDFRVGAAMHLGYQSNFYRIRFYHISSHLGDDYIIRNQIERPNDRSQNYELLEFTFLKEYSSAKFYLGSGYIVSKYAYRDRWHFQLGGWYTITTANKKWNGFIGSDLRILQEEEYDPSVRIAAGLLIQKENRPIGRIFGEYYSGYLPYSTLEWSRIHWYGIAMHWMLY